MTDDYNGPNKFIYRDSHKTHKFQLTEDGSPYDLTNVTEITFEVKEDNSDEAEVVFDCTMTGDAHVVRQAPFTDGKINVNVIPADTTSAMGGKKVYYIYLVDASAQTIYFGKGEYKIIRT